MAVPPSGAPATARPAGANSVPRRVAILVYDGVTLLDVAGPAEAFKEANRFGADYRIVLLSPTGEDVTSNLGFGVTVDGAVSSERAVCGRTNGCSSRRRPSNPMPNCRTCRGRNTRGRPPTPLQSSPQRR